MKTRPALTDGHPRRREGAILGLVLVMLVVLSVFGVGLLSLGAAAGQEAGRSIGAVQAFWSAEAGVEQVKAILLNHRRPMPQIIHASSPSGFLYGANAVTGALGQISFAVEILDAPGWTNGVTAIQKYLIRSRSLAPNGARQQVSLVGTIESFASYMHASNYEFDLSRGNIFFGAGDFIDGPVYVNDELNIYGTPVFLQHVSSTAGSVNYQNGGTSAVFRDGLTLNAAPLDFAGAYSSDHIAALKQEALHGGLALTGDYNLNFRSDGSFVYRRRGTTNDTTAYLSDLNGAIYVSGDAWVNGVVRGRVTVAAQDAIYISNSVTYATATSPHPWQTNTFNPTLVTDSLGLMASNQIQIAGTQAVTIHAALMVTADGGGFNASNRYVNIGSPYINLYGSIAQYRRGIVGQSSGTGYLKNYKYDTRFYADAPPHFPYSVYRYASWSQATL